MRKIKTNGILEEFKIQIGPARNSVQGELCGQHCTVQDVEGVKEHQHQLQPKKDISRKLHMKYCEKRPHKLLLVTNY